MRRQRGTRSTEFLTRTAISAALMCVSAMLTVPFFVPFTLQTFALYFILFLFGGSIGLSSACLYVVIGLIGLPVFSGFTGGVGCLFLPGGGFIPGFVMAALVYLAAGHFLHCRIGKLLSAALSFITLYICGTLGLAFLYGKGEMSGVLLSFAYYILPYILPDVAKIALAATLASRLKKYI